MPNINVINGFKHPRTIIADFGVAQLTIAYFVQQVLKYRKFRPSPIIIIHFIDELAGGLTQLEVRALKELCLMTGGRYVYCWQGLELSNQELKTLAFSSSKGKLLD